MQLIKQVVWYAVPLILTYMKEVEVWKANQDLTVLQFVSEAFNGPAHGIRPLNNYILLLNIPNSA